MKFTMYDDKVRRRLDKNVILVKRGNEAKVFTNNVEETAMGQIIDLYN